MGGDKGEGEGIRPRRRRGVVGRTRVDGGGWGVGVRVGGGEMGVSDSLRD